MRRSVGCRGFEPFGRFNSCTLDADLTGWDEYCEVVGRVDAVSGAVGTRRDLYLRVRVPAAASGHGGHAGLVAEPGRVPTLSGTRRRRSDGQDEAAGASASTVASVSASSAALSSR